MFLLGHVLLLSYIFEEIQILSDNLAHYRKGKWGDIIMVDLRRVDDIHSLWMQQS